MPSACGWAQSAPPAPTARARSPNATTCVGARSSIVGTCSTDQLAVAPDTRAIGAAFAPRPTAIRLSPTGATSAISVSTWRPAGWTWVQTAGGGEDDGGGLAGEADGDAAD